MRKWAPILLSLVSATQASGEPPPPAVPALEAQVQLVSGKLLRGRVVGTETIQGNSLLQVDTDWGRILVPAKEVKHSIEPKPTPDATFFAGDVRVVRIQGTVERQTATAGDWFPVQWTDAYGKEIVNSPNAIVKPGDRIRTGGDGEIDLQLHKDVWVRLAPDSEILLPAARGESGSLTLLKGATIHDVTGRPRGETFRVATPTIVLGVKGTRFAVRVGEIERVEVTEGAVQVGALGAVAAGYGGSWVSGKLEREPLTMEQREGLTVQIIRLPAQNMAWVPAGTYTLGDGTDAMLHPEAPGRHQPNPSDEPFNPDLLRWREAEPKGLIANIRSTSTTRLEAFQIGIHEVTFGQLSGFCLARARTIPRLILPMPPADASRAAFGIPWEDARAFAAWMGGKLPTEAQWEAAARGTERRLYPWKGPATERHLALPTCRVLWSQGGAPHAEPAPVEDRRPADAETLDVTPLGVRNLVTGVAEWTRDWVLRAYRDRYVGRELWAPELPRGDRPGHSDEGLKVIRGWAHSARIASGLSVGTIALTGPVPALPGFRCVIEP